MSYIWDDVENDVEKSKLKDAINVLADYCAGRACMGCALHSDTDGCLFGCGNPHLWVEIMSERYADLIF